MEQKIEHLKTFRYFTYGNPEKASKLWFVLHGYGQLPEFFIRKFHAFDPDEHFIVAPEGMHRFYLEGTSGRVGASWMTKEARADDISDNMRFLETLSERFSFNHFDQRILLGFSQGGATAARWHELGTFKADLFILWASVFPPDLELPKHSNTFTHSSNHFVVGESDPYYDAEHREKMTEHLKTMDLNFHCHTFDGGHAIDFPTLQKITTRDSI